MEKNVEKTEKTANGGPEFRKIGVREIDSLWELQKLYKAEIGENEPEPAGKERLEKAIAKGAILFFGAFDGQSLVGCCSVTVGFSTFDYRPSGVFEDFFIRPEYRHRGLARRLVRFAYGESGASAMTVGCADCDLLMYDSLGFSIPLGNLMAYDAEAGD